MTARIKIVSSSDDTILTPLIYKLDEDFPDLLDGFSLIKQADLPFGSGEPAIIAMQIETPNFTEAQLNDIKPIFEGLRMLLQRYAGDGLQLNLIVEIGGKEVTL